MSCFKLNYIFVIDVEKLEKPIRTDLFYQMTTMKPTYYYSESCVHISVNNSEELLFVIVGSSSFLSTEHGTTLMLKINKSEITFFSFTQNSMQHFKEKSTSMSYPFDNQNTSADRNFARCKKKFG